MAATKGRPTKYTAALNKQAEKLCRLGATDKEIADFFGIAESTLNLWKLKHAAFSESLKRGKDELDAQVEQSLFRRAMGYSHTAVKMFQAGGAIIEREYVEHYPPETAAMVFWLKNRQPERWRDKVNHEHCGPDGGSIPVALDASKLSDAALKELLNVRRGEPDPG